MASPWHFSRVDLADVPLNILRNGMASAITLMAPWKMGKTAFLQYDLLRQAEHSGWRVRYFSCSDVAKRLLLPRLEDALSDFAAGEQWLKRQMRRLGAAVPAKRTEKPRWLAQELAQLDKEKKHSLLLIDDIDLVLQQQGGSVLVEEMLRAFKAANGKACVVMTITQQHEVECGWPMLAQGTTLLTLPGMGDEFVHHMIEQYHLLTDRKPQGSDMFGQIGSHYQGVTWGQIDERALLAAFDRLHRIPHHFRALIEDLALNPGHSPEEALQQQQAQLRHQRASMLSWEELSRLDRLLLLEIAHGQTRLYGTTLRQALADLAGMRELSPSQVQNSLNKLVRNSVLLKLNHGGYQIVDPYIAATLAAERNRNHA
jgi:hypothetical protein